MRKYQRVWEHIKQYGAASLEADPDLHLRIIRAVRKEKCKDLGWKLVEQDTKSRVYKLEEEVTDTLITFTLVDCTPDYKNI